MLITLVLGLFTYHQYLISQPVIAFTSYVDLMTPEKAAAVAEHIVIGKVVKELGTYEDTMLPYTDFEILVEKNLKGDLSGTFVFAQEGGYNSYSNRTIQFGNYKIFSPGERYLLFLKKSAEGEPKYYSVGSGPAVYKIEDDTAINMFPLARMPLTTLEKISSEHQ